MTTPKKQEPVQEEQGLQHLLNRLAMQSQRSDFQAQRQTALGLVLEPYLDPRTSQYLSPLDEEIHLAEWYLFADYVPTDGHPTLVEQIRDTITEHVPQEERQWLDPLRHSYMDVLIILNVDASTIPNHLELQSLGDQQRFRITHPVTSALQENRILLTRLIRAPSVTCLPGPPLILSKAMGNVLLTFAQNLRQHIEFSTGNFGLAEWPEFSKQYGYLLIWSLARLRGGVITEADEQVTYWTETGQPFLYAIALYAHHEYQSVATGLKEWKELIVQLPNSPGGTGTGRTSDHSVWVEQTQKPDGSSDAVARLTLTPTQLIVEADSDKRLDDLKHRLAATFGFSLHFQGETLTPPQHAPPQVDLLASQYIAPHVTVPTKEEAELLSSFLERVYLEWAEQPCPALHNETPRRYARHARQDQEVATLIDQMEQHDLGLLRTGQPAYDYNILRAHIGF